MASDSVGNDAAKHNFNVLSLEAKICNLSSKFFGINEGFVEVFNNFLTEARKIDSFAKTLQITPGTLKNNADRYNQMYTTVALLSSYWQEYELTTLYPSNLSLADNPFIPKNVDDEKLDKKTISAFTRGTNLDTSVFYLQKFLSTHHPLSSYTLNTKINVCVPIYSRIYDPKNPENAQLISKSNPLSHFTRTIKNAELTRIDTNITGVKIFKFLRTPSAWSLINMTSPSPLNALGPSLSARQTLYIKIGSNVANYDLGEMVAVNPNYKPGVTDIILEVAAGVKVYSITPAAPALVLGNVDDSDTIALINYGLILGAGGTGGTGGNATNNIGSGTTPGNGSPGGAAIAVFSEATIIENRGAIYGGGGGGAGGFGGVGGSLVVGGGGGGGAGYEPGESGIRGTNDKLMSRSVLVADGQSGSNINGGKGGPGLFGDASLTEKELDLIIGKYGGNTGEKGQDAVIMDEDGNSKIIAYGGEAGAFVLGNNNVYWTITGDRKGRMVT